ncbi:MAG: signal peptidase I [Oscillospiraceae bacterium]|nr:signal peptidase I [Oscillospiraceae bacterium]
MSLDQNDSVESTLEEILAELGLTPAASSASPGGNVGAPEEKPAPQPSASAAGVRQEPEQPLSQSPAVQTVAASAASVVSEPEKSSAEPEPPAGAATAAVAAPAEAASGTEESSEQEREEPSTVVFSPARLREQMKAAAVSAAAVPSSPHGRAVSSRPTVSLKEELAQLTRSGGSHTATETLRAKDPAGPVQGAPRKASGRREALPVSVASDGKRKYSLLRQEILEWVRALVIAFAAAFLVFFVLIRVVSVDGTSMDPTLKEGDRLIISGLFYTPENGDIVVTSSKNGLNKPLIKRVIAVAGQTVDIDKDGRLLVNGLILDEPYLEESGPLDPGSLTFPLTVPEGCVFLLGDNREVSVDSRSGMVGMIDEKEIKGRVLLRFWPLNRLGGVD